jgi:hypothetical protein
MSIDQSMRLPPPIWWPDILELPLSQVWEVIHQIIRWQRRLLRQHSIEPKTWLKRFACFLLLLFKFRRQMFFVLEKIMAMVDSPSCLRPKGISVKVTCRYVSIPSPWLNYCEGFTLLARWIRFLFHGRYLGDFCWSSESLFWGSALGWGY